jgi:flagellar assembly protein FliH
VVERRRSLSNLIKSDNGAQKAFTLNAVVLERDEARVHRVKRKEEEQEEKAALELRVRHECEVFYTSQIAAAYEKGFSDGTAKEREAGTKVIEACRADIRKRSDEVFTALATQYETLRLSTEKIVIDLAMEISTRVVKREIEISSPVITHIREAIKRILGVEKVQIKININDEDLVRSHKGDLHQAADSVKEFVIDSDEKISAGGCILESELGNVDARIEFQLKQIDSALREHSRN